MDDQIRHLSTFIFSGTHLACTPCRRERASGVPTPARYRSRPAACPAISTGSPRPGWSSRTPGCRHTRPTSPPIQPSSRRGPSRSCPTWTTGKSWFWMDFFEKQMENVKDTVCLSLIFEILYATVFFWSIFTLYKTKYKANNEKIQANSWTWLV